MTIKEKAAAMKLDSTLMASKPAEMRNRALSAIIKATTGESGGDFFVQMSRIWQRQRQITCQRQL